MNWKKADIVLRYELGDTKLLEKRFNGITCTSHFLDLTDDVTRNLSSSILDQYGVDVAQIVSCPIDSQLKTVAFSNGTIVYCTSRYHHHYIDTQISFDEFDWANSAIIHIKK